MQRRLILWRCGFFLSLFLKNLSQFCTPLLHTVANWELRSVMLSLTPPSLTDTVLSHTPFLLGLACFNITAPVGCKSLDPLGQMAFFKQVSTETLHPTHCAHFLMHTYSLLSELNKKLNMWPVQNLWNTQCLQKVIISFWNSYYISHTAWTHSHKTYTFCLTSNNWREQLRQLIKI